MPKVIPLSQIHAAVKTMATKYNVSITRDIAGFYTIPGGEGSVFVSLQPSQKAGIDLIKTYLQTSRGLRVARGRKPGSKVEQTLKTAEVTDAGLVINGRLFKSDRTLIEQLQTNIGTFYANI